MANTDSAAKKDYLRQQLAQSRLQLRTLLNGLSPAQWQLPVYGEGEGWTVRDVVTHLVDAEYGMTAQIERIRQGVPTIPEDFDLDRWNKRTVAKMADKTPQELLQSLAQNRAKLLEMLDSIRDDEWEKQGRHPSLRILTIEQYIQTIAGHEAKHAADIGQAVEAGE